MLTQKLILSYFTRIVIQFTSVIASIVVARIAGPTVLGTVAFGTAYASMLLFLGDLGLGTAHVKLISEGVDRGKCLATYTRLKLSAIGIYLVSTIALFSIQIFIFDKQFESPEHQTVIYIFIGMVTLQLLVQIPNRSFAANTEQAKRDIPELIRSLFLHVTRIVLVIVGFRAIGLSLVHLASIIIVIPIIIYFFREYKYGKYDSELAKRYLKIAFPNILLVVSTTLVAQLDKVLLQFFTNSEKVGHYTAGYRIGGFIIMIAQSVGMLFFPVFSKAFKDKDYNSIKEKIEKFEKFSFIFIMPAVIFLAVYSDSIVNIILGPKYIPSIYVLSIITVAMFIMVLNMPYGNVLTGMGLFNLTAKISFVNVFIFLGSMFALCSPAVLDLSANGAAIAVLISNLFLGISYRLFAKKNLSIINVWKFTNYFLYGIGNFVVSYVVYINLIKDSDVVLKVVFPIVYFVFTFGSMYLLKLFGSDDIKMLKSLIDFKSMRKYIGKEIKK